MTTRRSFSPLKLLAAVVVLIVAAAAIWFGQGTKTETAPAVTFRSIEGETITTADLRGKVALVNFWATSCTTCVAEMPMLVETYRKYVGKGYETVAVAMQYDPPNYVLNFAKTRALPFKVALDPMGELAARFGPVRLTPTSFLIDKQGRIVKRYVGAPDEAELHTLIEQLLAQA